MPDMILNQPITPESTMPTGITHARLVGIHPDGSRKIVKTASVYNDDSWPRYRPNYLDQDDCIYIAWFNPDGTSQGVQVGDYLQYPNDFGAAHSVDNPVNQIPYLLKWREHLSRIAHEFVAESHNDLFHMQTNSVGFGPDAVTHSTDQIATIEYAITNMRRVLGIVWGWLDNWEQMTPETDDNWKVGLPIMQAGVDEVCSTCGGRGFKHHLLTNMNLGAWRTKFGEDANAVFYPLWNAVTNKYDVGRGINTLETHRTEALVDFNRALEYYRMTTGLENIHDV